LNPGPPTAATEDQLGASPCPVVNHKRQQLGQALQAPLPEREGQVCRHYDNGIGLGPVKSNPKKVDVKLMYTVPEDSCWPCNVTYSVSAAIAEDEYVAIGFKGVGYRKALPDKSWNVSRPGYFGMSKDEFDRNRTQAAIVLGYAGSAGSCVREMESKEYVGAPTDVEGNPNIQNESAERVNGRTVISFTVEQHAGKTDKEIAHFFNAEQLSQKTMWAIGAIDGVDCDAKVQFHRARGMSPLAWFDQNPKVRCKSADFGLHVQHTEVSV